MAAPAAWLGEEEGRVADAEAAVIAREESTGGSRGSAIGDFKAALEPGGEDCRRRGYCSCEGRVDWWF